MPQTVKRKHLSPLLTMELLENTLILATLLAVGIYYFVRQRGVDSHQEISPELDADERKRRREHLAKAAEARVAMLQSEKETEAKSRKNERKVRSNDGQSVGGISPQSDSNKEMTADTSHEPRDKHHTETHAASHNRSELTSNTHRGRQELRVINNACHAMNAVTSASESTSALAESAADVAAADSAPSVDPSARKVASKETSSAAIKVAEHRSTSAPSYEASNDGKTAALDSTPTVATPDCMEADASVVHGTHNKDEKDDSSALEDTLTIIQSETSTAAVDANDDPVALNSSKISNIPLEDASPTDKAAPDAKIMSTEANTSKAQSASIETDTSTQQTPAAPEIQTSQITVHLLLTSSPSTPKTNLSISPNCTTQELRQAAAETTSVPLNELRLIYRGRVILDSDKCIKEYGVEEGSVLHLVGKPLVANEVVESNAVENDAVNADSNNNDEQNDMTEQQSNELENNSIENDASSQTSNEEEVVETPPPIHQAAAVGNLEPLQTAAIHTPQLLFDLDINGWTPLHEAARGGHLHIIAFLIQEAQRAGFAVNDYVNTVSNFGNGWSPLALAVQCWGEGHAVVIELRRVGGRVLFPRR